MSSANEGMFGGTQQNFLQERSSVVGQEDELINASSDFAEVVSRQRESGFSLKQLQSADKSSRHQIPNPNNISFQNNRQRVGPQY